MFSIWIVSSSIEFQVLDSPHWQAVSRSPVTPAALLQHDSLPSLRPVCTAGLSSPVLLLLLLKADPQMEPDMKPGKRLKRWQEMVEVLAFGTLAVLPPARPPPRPCRTLSDMQLYGSPDTPETPVLFFKRNSHLTLVCLLVCPRLCWLTLSFDFSSLPGPCD